MGATGFWVSGTGVDALDAFVNARKEALYEHGHGGYTGTIAEKDGYTEIALPEKYKDKPQLFAQELYDNDDERICDKWGPACCINLDETTWLFFGTASC